MKTKIQKYGSIFIIVIMALIILGQYFATRNVTSNLKEYKDILIIEDSLRRVTEGHYQKLVDDRNSQRDIRKILKEHNRELFELLKDEKKKPITYTVIQAKPESIQDTVKIKTEIKEGKKLSRFSSFYPNKKDYFASYTGQIDGSTVNGEWNFNNLEIGLVISEKSRGLFEADLDAPSWLKVGDIKVNTLPLDDIKKERFDWLLGVETGINLMTQQPVVGLEGGIRFNKSIISATATSNKEAVLSYKKLF